MKKHLIAWLKLIVPLAIIVGLCLHVWRHNPEAIRTLREGQVRPSLLIAAIAFVLAAHVTAISRWHLLLRALHIPIRFVDTLRLGFMGLLFSFVSPGQVGGDVFKGVFIAREQSDRRAAAVATIIVDRACGLYGLLFMTTCALLISNVSSMSYQVAAIAKMTYLLTALGGIVIALALTPPLANSELARRLTLLPFAGRLFAKVLAAVRLYQRQPRVLAAVGVMSLTVHSLMAIAIFLVARAIYRQTPPLLEHFVIGPLAGIAGALPLAPGGLGSFELALTYLYDLFSPADQQGRGILIALMYRPATIVVASVGVIFYWLNHREVQQALRAAEQVGEKASSPATTGTR